MSHRGGGGGGTVRNGLCTTLIGTCVTCVTCAGRATITWRGGGRGTCAVTWVSSDSGMEEEGGRGGVPLCVCVKKS